MFRIILILICSLVHVYVFWRISSVPFVKQYIIYKYMLLIGLLIWVILFSGFFIGHNRTGILASVLEFLAMTWMAVLFLTFISLFAADIFTGFGFFFPRLSSSIRASALILASLLSLAAFIQGIRAPAIANYEVHLMDLPVELNDTVIAALSDLHVGSQLGSLWLSSRVAQVNNLQPDLIVLLGDIVEGHDHTNNDVYAKTLSHLSAPLGVWAVPGNHENFVSSNDNSADLFEKAGIPVLRGKWKELKSGLILAGVDSIHRRMERQGADLHSITQVLANLPYGAVILLSHFPQEAEGAANAGADLMLCGHTHGGQIWPFSYIVKAFYPLLAGEYDVNGMPVIVTRGAGTWGPRMRLWKRGEILRVTLMTIDDNNK